MGLTAKRFGLTGKRSGLPGRQFGMTVKRFGLTVGQFGRVGGWGELIIGGMTKRAIGLYRKEGPERAGLID